MTYSIDNYIENITESLNYIISLNLDVDKIKKTCNDEDIENIDFEYFTNGYDMYVLFIEGKRYTISAFMNPRDALFVLENIKSISYLYCIDDNWDSFVGKIFQYFNKDIIRCHNYEKFVKESQKEFSIEEILDYIERGS